MSLLPASALAGLRSALSSAFTSTGVEIRTMTSGAWSSWASLAALVTVQTSEQQFIEGERTQVVAKEIRVRPMADATVRLGDQVRWSGLVYAIRRIEGAGVQAWACVRVDDIGMAASDTPIREGAT